MASNFLLSEGYEIISKNFTTRSGEIDIVALEHGVITFVEVKYRTNKGFGEPEDFVTKSKLEKILKAARYYLVENELSDNDWRIDVVAIDRSSGEYKLLKNVYVDGFK